MLAVHSRFLLEKIEDLLHIETKVGQVCYSICKTNYISFCRFNDRLRL
jgi:hypothetical protein